MAAYQRRLAALSITMRALCAAMALCLMSYQRAASEPSPILSPAYDRDGLKKLRTWELAWAGKRIGKHNVQSIAPYLPDSYVSIYREPGKWGAPSEGFFFTITPYRRIVMTKGMRQATNTYAPQVVMDSRGALPRYAEIAGMPFPSPSSGLQIAWNFDFNTHGDACSYTRVGTNIIPTVKTEKVGIQDAWELFWIHRVDVPPKPAFQKNPKGISRSTFYHMHSPPEFKNTRMFNLRFIDPQKSDNAYMWYSTFRRIQRISNAHRTDAIDGTDLIYDDEYMWDGQILRNTYSLKGRREMLCARHVSIDNATRQKGQAILNNIVRERLNTYVVEVTSRDPSYIYGKRIWYVDPETYLIMWTEIYDSTMRFWKCFENLTGNRTTKTGEQKNFIAGAHYVDFQRVHSGIWQNTHIDVGISIDRSMFTLYNLQKGGY